jgi:glycosyltransferase involved in cell wall biosynthesis/predicted  nucleic acid-binding Zn-ribbon protein
LGTHTGVSYCAFCQAVKTLGLDTAAYAVDTWQGDAHTNKSHAAYADDVLEDLKRHHDPRYADFSTLIQSTFEEAVSSFADGSIDLLHIDGYHTYEAVRGDFETWLPKLSQRAVVLFHDINERRSDFGAWRFWEEVSTRFPSFHFLHGHGLGVLAVGREQPDDIQWLTALDNAEKAQVRDFFEARGRAVQTLVELEAAVRRAKTSAEHAQNLRTALDNQTENLHRTIEGYEARLRDAAERSRQELEDALRKLHEANLSTDQARKELTDAFTQLHEANLRTQKVNEQAIRRQGVIDETHRRLASLESELQAKIQSAAVLETTNRALSDQAARLNTEISRLREEAAQVPAKIDSVREPLERRLRFLELRVRSFETSASWRATAPLRAVIRTVRQFTSLFRSTRHRLELKRCYPIEISDTPAGHADWYEASSSRSYLPTKWVSLSYLGPKYDGTIFFTLYVDPGDGLWYPVRIPSITGKLNSLLIRFPDALIGLRLKVQWSAEHVPGPPMLVLREIGRLEMALRTIWQERRRAPNALAYLLRHGISATQARFSEVYAQTGVDFYGRWIAQYDQLTEADRGAISAHIRKFPRLPLISVVVPVYNTPERYLRMMLDSVISQLYPNWELCIADDASTALHVRPLLEDYARRDSRIKVVFRKQNGHISAASNSALELATGSHVALLDHDDLLAEHALYIIADAINQNPGADIFYSDEDKIDGEDRRSDPYFKPDFGLDLMLGQNYVSHLGVYRLETVKGVGGFRPGFEGSQDYDLVLRILARTKSAVVHLPWILYHWRLFPGAGTFSSTQIDKASQAARRAIDEHLAGIGVKAEVKPWVHAYHRVVRGDLPVWPKASIIVPTRDHLGVLTTCVEGVLERTDYPDIELVIANNDSVEPETLAYFDKLRADARVRILDCPGAFNFSAINNAAIRASTGEIVVLLNNDIEIIDGGWLKEMVKHAVRPEVGAVGAKLLYPDNTIQHGSVVLGMNGVAGHLHVGVPADSPGYFGWLKIAHNVSAVTAACLAMRRSVFDEVGGLDEVNLKVAFNDVDLCLKVTEKNYQIIWTPEATLYHWESKSRGNDLSEQHIERFKSEVELMRQRWGDRLDNDPFFNPNLSLSTCHPVAGFPPRVQRPWQPFLRQSAET